jgi:5-methylcytosine-specific restriction endonuclease McrA
MADGKTYWEKLQDPKWQEKRLRVMQRAGFGCEWCGAKDKTLEVHHGYYTRSEPWDYPDNTLYCLCGDCHKQAEDRKHDVQIEAARVHPQFLGELFIHILEFRERIARGEIEAEKAE